MEVWCEAPIDVMWERFRTRPRHFAHQDTGRADEWAAMAREARPISRFPVIRVDTGRAVDVPALAAAVTAALAG